MSDPWSEGPQAKRARRGRNIALALTLGAFVVLVFVISMMRMSGH